jgi:hypothetical protein
MVTCDVVRAALGGGDAGPADAAARPDRPAARGNGLPPFDAARSAILRDMVQGGRYALAAAVMQSTFLAMVVAGAAAGCLTVALLGARPALGFDAARFVVSALLIKSGVPARPAAAASVLSALRQLAGRVRVVLGDRALRILLMLGWLAAFYEIPAGIARPTPPGSAPGRSAWGAYPYDSDPGGPRYDRSPGHSQNRIATPVATVRGSRDHWH